MFTNMKKIELSQLYLKQDMDKVLVLHFGQLIFLLIGLCIEIAISPSKMGSFIKVLFLVIVSRLFYRTLKNLYYTFWTFSIFFLVFYLMSLLLLVNESGSFSLMNCYLFAMVLLVIEMKLLYSPLFYPNLSWWEYDFRYRHDLKITLLLGDKEFNGRLTDLRRSAGCIQVFESLNIGDHVGIKVDLKDQPSNIVKGEIISKRQYSLGRPWSYGIKMHFENVNEQDYYQELEKNWKLEKKDKIRKKFNKASNDNEKPSSL